MNKKPVSKPHWSFWLIAAVGVLWNLGGSMNYLMQMDMEFVASLPDTHRAIIEGRPVWATGGFAVGVFGGAIACLLLLMKRSLSLYIFVVSLLGILLTMIHTMIVGNTKVEFSAAEIFVMGISPVLVAVFFMGYTRYCMRKAWLV